MSDTTAPSQPFASPEEFFDQCDLHRLFEEWAADHRRRSAMISAGFRLDRCEQVPTHDLTILAGSRPLAEEPRTTQNIRRAVARSFRHEGFNVRTDMIAVYWSQTRVRIHLAVLEEV